MEAGVRPKVLYIAGAGRSGSTILSVALGQAAERWFNCGELWYVWHNDRCSCGAATHHCEYWGPIVASVLQHHGVDVERVRALVNREELGVTPARLLAIARDERRVRGGNAPKLSYPDVLSTLYAEIERTSNASVIIDSSKYVTRLDLLARLVNVDLYVVHLVRDPRAVAFSWTRQRQKQPGVPIYTKRRSALASARTWMIRNLEVEVFERRRLGDRYRLVRYEDLAEDPGRALRDIAAFVGEPAHVQIQDGATVPISRPIHSVGGNIGRFARGEIVIRVDDEWTRHISRARHLATTAVCAPLLARYEYPLRSRSVQRTAV